MSGTFTEMLSLDDGTEVAVEFTQSQYYPATGASLYDPGSPAEGGEIDIVSISTEAGEVKPSESEMKRLYDELYAMSPHEAAIQAKQKATVEVATKEQELAKTKVDALITVTQAEAEAASQLAVATNKSKAVEIAGLAEASAIKAKGDAEAEVIKAKAAALQSNPALIELTKAEAWNGVLPTTMIPGQTVPFIDVKPSVAVGP